MEKTKNDISKSIENLNSPSTNQYKINSSDIKNVISNDIRNTLSNTLVNHINKDNIYFDIDFMVKSLTDNFFQNNINEINTFINNYNLKTSNIQKIADIFSCLKESDIEIVYKKDKSVFLEFNFVHDIKLEFLAPEYAPIGNIERERSTINIYLDNIKIADFQRKLNKLNIPFYSPNTKSSYEHTLSLLNINANEFYEQAKNSHKNTNEENLKYNKIKHLLSLFNVFSERFSENLNQHLIEEPKIKNIDLLTIFLPEYLLEIKTKNEIELANLKEDIKSDKIISPMQFKSHHYDFIRNMYDQYFKIGINGKDKQPIYKNKI